MRESIVLCLTLVLAFSVTSIDGARRVRRQSIFTVAEQDSSFPCDGPQAKVYAALGLPFVELTNEQKLELMHKLGGEFLHAYMSFDGSAEEETLRNVLEPNRHLPKPDVKRGQFPSTRNVNPADEQASAPSQHSASIDVKAEEAAGVQDKRCFNRTQAYKTETPKYLRMCTACTTVRHNPPDVWPEFFYEAECDEDQLDCLFDKDGPNGRCQQNTMEVNVLVKKPGRCVTELANGEKVVTHEWALTSTPIGSGCECAVDKDSPYK